MKCCKWQSCRRWRLQKFCLTICALQEKNGLVEINGKRKDASSTGEHAKEVIMITYEDIRRNEAINTYIKKADESLKAQS